MLDIASPLGGDVEEIGHFQRRSLRPKKVITSIGRIAPMKEMQKKETRNFRIFCLMKIDIFIRITPNQDLGIPAAGKVSVDKIGSRPRGLLCVGKIRSDQSSDV